MVLPSELVRSAWLAQMRLGVSCSERSGARMPPAVLRLDVRACPVAGPEPPERARVRLMENLRREPCQAPARVSTVVRLHQVRPSEMAQTAAWDVRLWAASAPSRASPRREARELVVRRRVALPKLAAFQLWTAPEDSEASRRRVEPQELKASRRRAAPQDREASRRRVAPQDWEASRRRVVPQDQEASRRVAVREALAGFRRAPDRRPAPVPG